MIARITLKIAIRLPSRTPRTIKSEAVNNCQLITTQRRRASRGERDWVTPRTIPPTDRWGARRGAWYLMPGSTNCLWQLDVARLWPSSQEGKQNNCSYCGLQGAPQHSAHHAFWSGSRRRKGKHDGGQRSKPLAYRPILWIRRTPASGREKQISVLQTKWSKI